MQQVYDMSDLDESTAGGVQRVLACAGTLEALEPTEEEAAMEEDEDRACFPIDVSETGIDWNAIRRVLTAKLNYARDKGAL